MMLKTIEATIETSGEVHLLEPVYLAHEMQLRENTGRPLGETPFIEKIARLLGRDILPKKPGPKPKKGN
jgi:hypothetical protein